MKQTHFFKTYFTGLAIATLMPLTANADVVINEANFPDENFRNYLLGEEYGLDGVLTDEEIEELTFLTVNSKNISSLKGIEHFTALERLVCYSNQLTTLDVSKNTALIMLWCYSNQLTTLDVSKNTALTELQCNFNKLTALDLSKNEELTRLVCSDNQLASLDISKNTKLGTLHCHNNQLTTLDISKNTKLGSLYCNNNQLTTLDVSKNTTLAMLQCNQNYISGTAMDDFISTLPQNMTDYESLLYIYGNVTGEDNNVCTKSQVAVIKEKRWIPYYYNGVEWVEYEGADDETAGISQPTTESIVGNAPIYGLSGQRVAQPAKGGIYIVGGKKAVMK